MTAAFDLVLIIIIICVGIFGGVGLFDAMRKQAQKDAYDLKEQRRKDLWGPAPDAGKQEDVDTRPGL